MGILPLKSYPVICTAWLISVSVQWCCIIPPIEWKEQCETDVRDDFHTAKIAVPNSSLKINSSCNVPVARCLDTKLLHWKKKTFAWNEPISTFSFCNFLRRRYSCCHATLLPGDESLRDVAVVIECDSSSTMIINYMTCIPRRTRTKRCVVHHYTHRLTLCFGQFSGHCKLLRTFSENDSTPPALSHAWMFTNNTHQGNHATL